MDFTGHFDELMQDFFSGKQKVVLSINEDARKTFNDLRECEKVSITIKKYRRKRSLDANAYHWVLCTKIAAVLNTSKEEVHNSLLRSYGQIELDESGKPMAFSMLSKFDMERRTDMHVKAIGQRFFNGKSVTDYIIIKGSHQYDTKEMSILIDGTVQDAKELGIETATPDEIEKMKQQWGLKLEKTKKCNSE